MIQILKENQFVTQEFILSPLQFGVPYSRPRYFCLVCQSMPAALNHQWTNESKLKENVFLLYLLYLQAKRKPSSFCNPDFNGQLLRVPEPLFGPKETLSISENDQLTSISYEMFQTCLPIEQFLEFGNSMNQNTFSNEGSLDQYFVPSSLTERWGSAMGILDNKFSV